jgi:hypothetical protein
LICVVETGVAARFAGTVGAVVSAARAKDVSVTPTNATATIAKLDNFFRKALLGKTDIAALPATKETRVMHHSMFQPVRIPTCARLRGIILGRN